MDLKMRFNLIILIYLFTSCTTNYTKIDNRKPYNAKGFAYIFNQEDRDKNIIKGKMNNDLLEISHSQLKYGATIKLINPKTKDTIVLKNTKKIKYPEFYKIVISDTVANKLNIDRRIPIIEVLEIRKNKSFVAKKAKIYQEEKKIPANAPVMSVKIDNISKKKSLKNKEELKTNIYILIGSFYSEDSAFFLKDRIIKEIIDFDKKKIIIKRESSKEIEVISGPYKSVNLLKNDYIKLKNIGFEEMDIFINE
tara:strand:- start:1505 stop:2257 length:753 start_codon:yes stop_codon:yes gene_type:complete